VPFSSQLIGDYGDESAAALIYALNIGGLGLVGAAMVRYAFRRSLVKEGVAEVSGIHTGPGSWRVGAIFLLSLPIALVSANAAELSWLVMFVIAALVSRRVAARRAPG
jgi:hypothetical protein